VTQIVIQFVAQCIGVMLIRRYQKHIHLPFKMWLFPLPAILALLGWIAILVTSGSFYILLAFGLMAIGTIAYLIRAQRRREWPFAEPQA